MSSICPAGTSPSSRSLNWRTDTVPEPVEQPAARPVARAVQELLHPAQVQVAEQRLAHPREQQHLEVEDARHLAGHLPQHLPGDHGGARRRSR
jgi:hypothetical protein